MKVKNIELNCVGCIDHLSVNFNDRVNVLCGPNGVGKTTILESIASMFMYGNSTVKKKVGSDKGSISIIVDNGVLDEAKRIEIKKFNPQEFETANSFADYSRKLLSIKVNRLFGYSALKAIPSDPDRSEPDIWQQSNHGISISEAKGWFVNRYLYSSHPESLSEQQISNFQLAEKCFSIINPQYSFSRVLGSSNDIMVNTPQGEIYYEYLSSGFKSVLYILFGIIKEIEFRFKENNLKSEDFDGVILIDEVEVHLHPEWQERIIPILTDAFPKAQFIMTTHSPHVIQSLEPNQVLALQMNEDGNIAVRTDLHASKYGFKGWSVEEILYDVMGMKTLRSEMYHKLMKSFGEAIDNEDEKSAAVFFEELDSLLHPNDPQRKILQFQMARISEA